MIGAGSAASVLALAACAPASMPTPATPTANDVPPPPPLTDLPRRWTTTSPSPVPPPTKLGDPLNSYEDVTNYNNYYEFSTDKAEVARLSESFVSRPVGGGGDRSGQQADYLRRGRSHQNFTQEERIYRLRCVEAWSMVIPWVGFELGSLLPRWSPSPRPAILRFEAVMDPDQMPGQRRRFLNWPYVGGLRLDEAMNSLTILDRSVWRTAAQPQRRAVAPGGALEVRLQEHQGHRQDRVDRHHAPLHLDGRRANEYGFYANVNPQVDHPRWSQATESASAIAAAATRSCSTATRKRSPRSTRAWT
ncbi:MAG: mononuclear molybdenum enzyme YedY [Caldilineaceae bacterium]